MLILLALFHILAAQQDFLPTSLYRCDFEDNIQSCFQGITPQKPHNCLIVPCTNLDEINHCMVITHKTYGGDCFTPYFDHQVDPEEEDDLLIL